MSSTIGMPGTPARAVSVHLRIVSVARLIIARHHPARVEYGDAIRPRPAWAVFSASRVTQRADRMGKTLAKTLAKIPGRRRMLFTCLPEGAQIPGRFPGPVHARGKWFTIDIHCHVLTPKAEEMVKEAGLTMDWQPRHHFANERTRQVNREQAERNRVQFSSVEKRLEDMDRMGIDIQAITPSPAQTFYSVPAELGIATARVINDNLAEIC